MRLTIAICKFNRSALSRRALASLFACRWPDGDSELLVVDKNSSDDTRGVVREFDRRLPIRSYFESQ
jgi:glycosyltransferase involved in cell wall biosynthesis